MAGGAVVAEDRLAQLDRGRVPCDLVDRPPFVGREGFLEPGVVGRLRQRVLVVRGPAAEAIDPAKPAIPGQVADAERDHQVEPARKSVVLGKSVSVRVEFGGRLIIKTKTNTTYHPT